MEAIESMEPMNDEDILAEKIKAYRESLKHQKPDLDLELLMRILDMVNGESEVKIAIDPVDEDGGWSADAPTYAVRGVTKLEDGRIALRANAEHHGIEADTLYSQLKKALKHTKGSNAPVIFVRKGEVITLTDVYSHSLVRQVYAGMPFDVVLAVTEKKTKIEEA